MVKKKKIKKPKVSVEIPKDKPAILDAAPGADVLNPKALPRVGQKARIKREPVEVLERIADESAAGTGFIINPEKHANSEVLHESLASTQLGSLFMNFILVTYGHKLFAVGYTNKSKIEVLPDTQADTMMELLEKRGVKDPVITLIEPPSRIGKDEIRDMMGKEDYK